MDGEPVVGILIYLQTGANALETAEAVISKMEELKQRFPAGMGYVLPTTPAILSKPRCGRW